MKNTIFITLCICLVILNFGCKEDKNSEAEIVLSSECTFDQRKTVDNFVNEQGSIVFLKEHNLYTISGGKLSEKRFNALLQPCNLPIELQKDNLKVIFSGELKEVFEWEDMAAQPFKITKLMVNEN